MSQQYAQDRIKEAIRLSKGSKTAANQLVIAWAAEDHKLLWALTKAHLTGVVAYNVERVASGRADRAAAAKAAPTAKPRAQQDKPFGRELLKAASSGEGAIFGLEGYTAPSRAGQASQGHINAIHQLASRSKKT